MGQTSKGRTVKASKALRGIESDATPGLVRSASTLVPLVDPERVPKAGDLLEVEVAETEEQGGGVAWKPSMVREVLANQRFVACVNGEEDFLEEYGMEDEGKEWRKVAVADTPRMAKAYEAAVKKAKEAVRLLQERELAEANAAAAGGGETVKEKVAAARKRKKAEEEAPSKKEKEKEREREKEKESKSAYKFGFGMEVEVRGADKHYMGSWYLAEVLSAKEAGGCLVQYDALFESAAATGALAPAQEQLPAEQLRPKPPEPTAGWDTELEPGTPLELRHADGWWDVVYVAKQVGADDKLLVRATHWGQSLHLVDRADLRPAWRWAAQMNEWSVKAVDGRAKGGGKKMGGAGRGGK